MVDRYLLESGSPDGYLLEDGSGVLLLDANAATATLTDNFDDNSRDTAKWNLSGFYESETTGGTASETNQRVEVTPTAAAIRAAGYVSVDNLNLTNDSIAVKISNSAAFSSNQAAYLAFGPNDSNYYMFIIWPGGPNNLIARRRINGVNTDLFNIAYSATTHAWLRIRHQSSDNTIHFDTATSSASDPPASGDWTDRGSETFTSSLVTDSGKVAIGAALFGADASPGAAYFDGFNGATVGNQTLTPSLFTSSQTFYAPTVAAGSVTLTPSLFTNSQTFFAPTVVATYSLTPSLFANSQTFFAPTAAPGSVTLTPSPFTNAQAFFAPTVSPGTATLTPDLFTNSQTFYAPTVTTGSVTLTPSLFTNSQIFYSAVVSQPSGDQTLTPALFTNTNTFYAPTVSAGTVTLTPNLFTNGQVFYAPTVAGGPTLNRSLEPLLFVNSQVFYDSKVTRIFLDTILIPGANLVNEPMPAAGMIGSITEPSGQIVNASLPPAADLA